MRLPVQQSGAPYSAGTHYSVNLEIVIVGVRAIAVIVGHFLLVLIVRLLWNTLTDRHGL